MADCKACGAWFESTTTQDLCPTCKRALMRLGSYVAPVRHGHWIEDGDCQICSECGEEHCWDEYRAAYCDSCGAKMDGGDNTER